MLNRLKYDTFDILFCVLCIPDYKGKSVKVQIYDTAQYYRDCDGVILVYDISDEHFE